MIHIIEGVDCTGKTTLANKLSIMTGMRVVHFGAPLDHQEILSMVDMYKGFLAVTDNVIMDRSWYSERVYGPVLRGKEQITVAQQHELEDIVMEKGCIIHYCVDTVERIINRMNIRGDDLIKAHQIESLVKGYDRVMKSIDSKMLVMGHIIP